MLLLLLRRGHGAQRACQGWLLLQPAVAARIPEMGCSMSALFSGRAATTAAVPCCVTAMLCRLFSKPAGLANACLCCCPRCHARQGDDPELAGALAASLADHPDGSGSGARPARGAWGAPRVLPALHGDDEDADLAAAIAASLAGGGGKPQPARPMQAGSTEADDVMHGDGDDEDPELAAAIAASLEHQQEAQLPGQPAAGKQPAAQRTAEAVPTEQQAAAPAPVQQLPELGEEPAAGAEGAIEVALRLPGGGRASRRFRAAEDTVGHLAAFAVAQGADLTRRRCQLAAGFPRRALADWAASLAAAGIGHKELVTVEMA